MKKNTIKLMSIASAALMSLMFVSCGDNSWNDHELDGFKPDGVTDVQSLKYTLTATDYATLANNSTNKALAKEAGLEKELAAVGTQGYLTEQINAQKYVPALLSDASFPYFALSDGSSISLTYNVAQSMPQEVIGLSNAYEYEISDEDYQQVWGSDTEYTAAFTPKHPASKAIPAYLANTYDDAVAGAYAIVNCNVSDMDPIFGGGSVTPPTPAFAMSSVLGSPAVGSTLEVNGVVTATCTRGYILTDNAGSILVYYGSDYDNSYAIGDQLVLNGTVNEYGNGLQIDGTSATVDKAGTQAYTYPEPKLFTAADIEAVVNASAPIGAVFGCLNGTLAISGNYYNIILDGSDFKGSIYYASDEIKAGLADGEPVIVYGYLASKSGTVYGNIIVTHVEKATNARRQTPRRVVSVPSSNVNLIWYFDGSKWIQPTNAIALSADDYKAMGQSYGNLSGTGPETYLPTFLKTKYPYAQADDSMFVAYKYYNSSDKTTTYQCKYYIYNGSEWAEFTGYTQETAQFVRLNGKWMYDPNVTITLPAGRSVEISTKYYQACVDWVFENIDAKAPINSTSIKSGMGYVTSYGNNEYYSGTSAYQGNVDLRASKAKEQYPAGYEGMSDEEIVAKMKERFAKEVMPAALSKLHPDASPVAGMDVIYTINFGVYTGASETYTIRYKVVGPAQFEYMDCTWDNPTE